MNRRKRMLGWAVLLSPLLAWAQIVLPTDKTQFRPSTLVGYAKAQALCVACHSPWVVALQPASWGREEWTAQVRTMQREPKARIADDDVGDLVTYLVRTYGNERTP